MKADNTSNTDEGSRQAGKSMIARGEHVSSSYGEIARLRWWGRTR